MSTEQQELDLVEALAVRMRTKLRKNAHKTHWAELETADLLQWLKAEVTELEEALANEGPDAIADEAADVANFAAMIAAKAHSLPLRTESSLLYRIVCEGAFDIQTGEGCVGDYNTDTVYASEKEARTAAEMNFAGRAAYGVGFRWRIGFARRD